MNYCFLLEDEISLPKILPVWLDFMGFNCTRVLDIENLTKDTYVLQSGKGVTQLETKVIFSTLDTIIETTNKVDKLIIIVDAEDIGHQERKNRIYDKISKKYTLNGIKIPCEIHIFVCNRCLETWLLGCKGMYPKNVDVVSKHFQEYYSFYNIDRNDPEKMDKPSLYKDSVSSYHWQYLHALTQDISRNTHLRSLTYRKNNPGCVLRREYFDGMLQRIETTNDISSFKEFYQFILSEINNSKDTK